MFIVLLGVDMVHACCVPTVAGGFKNWTMTDFNFGIVRWSQLEDFESPDAASVLWYAVLGKAK